MDLGTPQPSQSTPASSCPPAPATLPLWERTMQRARGAAGQGAMALAYQQQALALSLRVLQQVPPAGREDDCVAALVVSHLNVADLQAQAAELDAAAHLLCRAHALVLGLLADGRHSPALRQAALRHSRETLAALFAYVAHHGPHPAIAQALASPRCVGLPH